MEGWCIGVGWVVSGVSSSRSMVELDTQNKRFVLQADRQEVRILLFLTKDPPPKRLYSTPMICIPAEL